MDWLVSNGPLMPWCSRYMAELAGEILVCETRQPGLGGGRTMGRPLDCLYTAVDVPGEDGNCRSGCNRWVGFGTVWVPLLVRMRFVGRERSVVSVMVPGVSWLCLVLLPADVVVGSIIWSDTCSVSIPLGDIKLVLVVSGTMCSG